MNLAPAARPQDVYSEVANLVEKKRKDDAKNGVLIAQQLEGRNSIPFSQILVVRNMTFGHDTIILCLAAEHASIFNTPPQVFY